MNLAALKERLPLSQLDTLRAEWEGNQRLRLGLLAIWALLLLYFVLVLADAADAARSDLVEVDQRKQRLEAILAQQYWLERAERSKAARLEVQDSFPVVASSGRAEAQVRSMLEQAIRDTGTRKLRLEMRNAEPLRDGQMWQVGATIQGVVVGDVARDFLAELEGKANYSRIERMKLIRGNSAEKVRVEVQLQYLFRAESR